MKCIHLCATGGILELPFVICVYVCKEQCTSNKTSSIYQNITENASKVINK